MVDRIWLAPLHRHPPPPPTDACVGWYCGPSDQCCGGVECCGGNRQCLNDRCCLSTYICGSSCLGLCQSCIDREPRLLSHCGPLKVPP